MILDLLFTYVPIILAFLGESVLIKVTISILNKKNIKTESKYQESIEQNKTLVKELRESKRLNKELLIKIDRIQRNEE